MPDSSLPPFDRASGALDVGACHTHRESARSFQLPASGMEAGLRGAFNKCPRCGEAVLFARFLKPMPHCPHCGQDWKLQQADDFPAYISIFLTGHLLAPLIILLVRGYEVPAGLLVVLILLLATAMMLAFLQPAKGCIIALQWWLGMHGFKRERPEGQD